MEFLPEIIAQATFVPSGLFMGYMFYIFEFVSPESLVHIHFWPWIIGICTTIVTAYMMTNIKMKWRYEPFQQFYYILIGITLFFTSGCLFLYDFAPLAVYVAAIGHGINYVAVLSYMNLRVSAQKRTFRIAICHVWYLLGCGLASQIINIASIPSLANVDPATDLFNKPFGILITITSAISMGLVILNELLHFFCIYNYKISLDVTLNEINYDKQLFINRDELIHTVLVNPVDGYNLKITPANSYNISMWLVLLKIKGFIVFSSVMIYVAGMASVNDSQSFDLVQWLVFAGAMIGLISFLFYSTRSAFILFSACQSLGLGVALMIYNDVESLVDTAYPLWLYYVFLGGGYCLADIAILELTPLKSTETALAVGYFIEIFPVALVQYGLSYQTEATILRDNLITFQTHGFVYVCLIIILIVIVSMVMPNTYGKSLVEIRNMHYGISYEKSHPNHDNHLQKNVAILHELCIVSGDQASIVSRSPRAMIVQTVNT